MQNLFDDSQLHAELREFKRRRLRQKSSMSLRTGREDSRQGISVGCNLTEIFWNALWGEPSQLLERLQELRLNNSLIDRSSHYSYDRKPRLRVNGSLFSDLGSPRGSTISPEMFTTFVNGHAKQVAYTFLVYADNANIYREVGAKPNVQSLKVDLDKLHRRSAEKVSLPAQICARSCT